MIAKRLPDEASDSVNLIVSLLVRHPELSRVIIKPRFAAIAFFFIVRESLGAPEEARFRESIVNHLRAFHELDRVTSPKIVMRLHGDATLTFIEIERDTRTLARDEIPLIVALVTEAFGEKLIVNPPAENAGEDEFGSQEDAVSSALDAVRRAKQRKGLVGFREERRVLIYFGNGR